MYPVVSLLVKGHVYLSTSGQVFCPLAVGSFVAAYGQFFMAADTCYL